MSRTSVRASIEAFALAIAVFGCDRRGDGGALAGTSSAPSALSGDATLTAQTKVSDVDVGPTAKLRGFRCTKPVHPGKSPRGPLTVRFTPTSPTDFTIHLEYHCLMNCQHASGVCDYSADLRAEHGVLREAFPGLPVRCTQSATEPFAIDCGVMIASYVEIVIMAQSTSRFVRFTLPSNFDQGIPDPPENENSRTCLPFVTYERTAGSPTRKSINLDYLRFESEDCELDP